MISDGGKPPDDTGQDGGKPPDDTGQERTIVEGIEQILTDSETVTGEKAPGSYAAVAGAMTNPWGVDSKKCAGRTYEEIIEESKKKESNVLSIRIEKLKNMETIDETTYWIDQNDVENIIFEELKVEADQIEEVDFTRYNVKEIGFKEGHDATKYFRSPFFYKGHMISVGNHSQTNYHTRVKFLNVPNCVPDEELLNFCEKFGKVTDPTVYYGKYQGGMLNGHRNGTRWIEAEFLRKDINYIWFEGPSSPSSTRVTITYSGERGRQCGHCLRHSLDGCPGFGKAKVCKEKNTVKRATAQDYMKKLEDDYGFTTLKAAYLKTIKKDQNNKDDTNNAGTEKSSDGGDSTEAPQSNKEEVEKLTKENNNLHAEMKIKNSKMEKNERRMKVLRRSIVKHLQDSLPDPLFESMSMSMLVMQLSLTISDDEYEVGENGSVTLKKEMIFEELDTDYKNEDDSNTAKTNLAAFIKAVENKMHVTTGPTGERRLSIGGKPESQKRKPSEESNLENDNKKSNSSNNLEIDNNKKSNSSSSKLPSATKSKSRGHTFDLQGFHRN